jgi:hypothetical protein
MNVPIVISLAKNTVIAGCNAGPERAVDSLCKMNVRRVATGVACNLTVCWQNALRADAEADQKVA